MGLILGGVPPHDLILDSQSVSLYIGGSPPVKVWPTWATTVQITLGTGYEARDQLRAALSDRGLDYQTVTEIPFDIELVGTGSTSNMFRNCYALTSVPAMDTSSVTDMTSTFQNCLSLVSVPDLDTSQVTNMYAMFWGCASLVSVPDLDTSQVTNMYAMFRGCASLTHVPDLDTSGVTNMSFMFYNCSALTDGNVRLIGRHPNVNTTDMITGSGLTREPFFNPDGTPDDGIEVHEVSLTDVRGSGTAHPLLTVTVPAGETWDVRIEGTVTKAFSTSPPSFRIGTTDSGQYAQGAAVDFSGTVTSANSTIALVTSSNLTARTVSFVGTVTIEK